MSIVCDSWKNSGAYSEKDTIEIWREEDNPPFYVNASDTKNFFNARNFYQLVPDIINSKDSTKEMEENAKTLCFEIIDGQNMADALGCKFVDDVKITESPSANKPNNAADKDFQDSDINIGERNALNKAIQYLDVMPFSYSGLIEQLEYSGFLTQEAVYAADHCGADWNEQAAKKARQYLEVMPFSQAGLIEQLEYGGFTHAQAVYGVAANGY